MTHTSRSIRLASVASLSLVAVLAACSSRESATADSAAAADSAATATAAPAPAPAPAPPSDAQIAHIAVTANALDSAAGAMARTKASAAPVKEFARMMVTDHGGVNKQAVALATKLGVTPEDNETSRSLTSSAESARASMQGLSGAAFDRAYMDNEVTYHQTVLDALDRTLIPNAQNAELKALLEKVRPNIAAHLERARTIQSSLGAQ